MQRLYDFLRRHPTWVDAFWAFVLLEGRRLSMSGLWVPIAANLLVGVSLGLPLFLYLREVRREAPARSASQGGEGPTSGG